MRAHTVVLASTLALSACDGEGAERPDCTEMECYRPYVCAPECGGPETNRGCCQCLAGEVDVLVDCRGAEAEPSEPDEATPPTGPPCETDADCVAVAGCDCACVPRARSTPTPEGDAWATQCDGQPPPNCGAQSPCAGYAARCDPDTRACAVDAPE